MSFPTIGEIALEAARDFLPDGCVKGLLLPSLERSASRQRERRGRIVDRALTLNAALIASNPNLLRSLQIEREKKRCIEEELCNPEEDSSWLPGDEGEECHVTWWEVLRICGPIYPSLADKKVVERHLRVESELGDLEKRRAAGKTYYVYRAPSDAISPTSRSFNPKP